MDLIDLMDKMDKMGASRYTPMGWLASVLVWLGRKVTVGVLPGNLIAAGVCVLRGRGTIKTDGHGKVRKLTEEWCAA